MRFSLAITLVVLSALAISCGKKKEDESKATELEGTWAQVCTPTSSDTSELTGGTADTKRMFMYSRTTRSRSPQGNTRTPSAQPR